MVRVEDIWLPEARVEWVRAVARRHALILGSHVASASPVPPALLPKGHTKALSLLSGQVTPALQPLLLHSACSQARLQQPPAFHQL